MINKPEKCSSCKKILTEHKTKNNMGQLFCNYNCAVKKYKTSAKYRNNKIHGYDSKLEYGHSMSLEYLLQSKQIKNLEKQVKVNIEVYNPILNKWVQLKRRYIVIDFRFEYKDKVIYMETKGGFFNSSMAQSVKYQLFEHMIDTKRIEGHFIMVKTKNIDLSVLDKL